MNCLNALQIQNEPLADGFITQNDGIVMLTMRQKGYSEYLQRKGQSELLTVLISESNTMNSFLADLNEHAIRERTVIVQRKIM